MNRFVNEMEKVALSSKTLLGYMGKSNKSAQKLESKAWNAGTSLFSPASKQNKALSQALFSKRDRRIAGIGAAIKKLSTRSIG